MTERTRGVTAFVAVGQTYPAIFDFNTVCDLEEEADLSLDSISAHLANRSMSAKTLRMMLWIGLRQCDETIKERDAGDIISQVGVTGVVGQIFGALIETFPPSKQDAPPAPLPESAAIEHMVSKPRKKRVGKSPAAPASSIPAEVGDVG